jgi:ribonucleoside-triphosphate reductase (thioredoxin)
VRGAYILQASYVSLAYRALFGDTGLHELRSWCDEGYAKVQEYDQRFSEWLTIPRSIKTTCIKPSGTVSLLAGGECCSAMPSMSGAACKSQLGACVNTAATPGLHFPESRFYLRRVRIGSSHELLAPLRAAGYDIEAAAEDPERKVVVTFPVDAGSGVYLCLEVDCLKADPASRLCYNS